MHACVAWVINQINNLKKNFNVIKPRTRSVFKYRVIPGIILSVKESVMWVPGFQFLNIHVEPQLYIQDAEEQLPILHIAAKGICSSVYCALAPSLHVLPVPFNIA